MGALGSTRPSAQPLFPSVGKIHQSVVPRQAGFWPRSGVCNNIYVQQGRILISCNKLKSAELFELLTEQRDSVPGCEFELKRRSASRASGLEPALVVAIISATSAAVSALITGLFRIIEGRYNRTAKVVIRGEDGTIVEVPAGTSPEQLQKFVDIAKSFKKPEVRVVLS